MKTGKIVKSNNEQLFTTTELDILIQAVGKLSVNGPIKDAAAFYANTIQPLEKKLAALREAAAAQAPKLPDEKKSPASPFGDQKEKT